MSEVIVGLPFNFEHVETLTRMTSSILYTPSLIKLQSQLPPNFNAVLWYCIIAVSWKTNISSLLFHKTLLSVTFFISTYSFYSLISHIYKKKKQSEDALFNFLKTHFYFPISNSLGQTRFLPNSYDFPHISGMAEQPQQYARCNKCLLNVFIIIQATIAMMQNSNMVHLFGAIISILHRTLNHKLIKPEPHTRKNRVSQFFYFFFSPAMSPSRLFCNQ